MSVISEEEVSELLVCALCQILTDLSSNSYTIISIETEESSSPQSENEPSVSNATETSSDQTKSHNRDQNTDEPGECSPKRQKFDQELFHSKLRYFVKKKITTTKTLLFFIQQKMFIRRPVKTSDKIEIYQG